MSITGGPSVPLSKGSSTDLPPNSNFAVSPIRPPSRLRDETSVRRFYLLRGERKRVVDAPQALVPAERGHGSREVRGGRAARQDRAELGSEFAHADPLGPGEIPQPLLQPRDVPVADVRER